MDVGLFLSSTVAVGSIIDPSLGDNALEKGCHVYHQDQDGRHKCVSPGQQDDRRQQETHAHKGKELSPPNPRRNDILVVDDKLPEDTVDGLMGLGMKSEQGFTAGEQNLNDAINEIDERLEQVFLGGHDVEQGYSVRAKQLDSVTEGDAKHLFGCCHAGML